MLVQNNGSNCSGHRCAAVRIIQLIAQKSDKVSLFVPQVAGVDLQNASHEEAVQAIKTALSPVEFIVQSLSSTPRVLLMTIATCLQFIISICFNDNLQMAADCLNQI